MRTVKRSTYLLNQRKLREVKDLCGAYSREKRYWLDVFRANENQSRLKLHREVRNEAIASGYVSLNGLQARMWKLALVDAAETWDKYWQAAFVEIRIRVARNSTLAEDQRRYLYWLMKDYSRFADALHGAEPTPPFDVTGSLSRLARYFQKVVRSVKGKTPAVKVARSFCLDANCYTFFVENGTQYLKIMSLKKGKRITIPLSGESSISGNIRILVDGNRVQIHKPQKIKATSNNLSGTVAVDLGYTEVMTDELDNGYGSEFGSVLTAASNRRHLKGKARNKLHAFEKKHRAAGNIAKASRIRKYNLGRSKLERQTSREQLHLENIINRSINALLRERKPELLISEDLRHAFTFDKPKGMNRRLSSWVKGVLQDRLEFKVLAGGSRHEQVNPAYGSQVCPSCGFVDSKNRNGDRFKCLHCGHAGHADQVAAMNYFIRKDDRQITRYTPYREVKSILLERFHRRLEAQQSGATVPGRTLDAVVPTASTGDIGVKTRSSRKQGGGQKPAVNLAA